MVLLNYKQDSIYVLLFAWNLYIFSNISTLNKACERVVGVKTVVIANAFISLCYIFLM